MKTQTQPLPKGSGLPLAKIAELFFLQAALLALLL